MIRWKVFKKNSERGQSFLELAISLVFLLILLAALVDLGWAFYTLIALRDAAQEAAVYGSMCPNHTDFIVDRLQTASNSPIDLSELTLENGQIVICVIDPANPVDSCADAPVITPQINYNIRIEAEVTHTIHTPFAATFIGRTSYPLRVDVTDTIMHIGDDDECK